MVLLAALLAGGVWALARWRSESGVAPPPAPAPSGPAPARTTAAVGNGTESASPMPPRPTAATPPSAPATTVPATNTTTTPSTLARSNPPAPVIVSTSLPPIVLSTQVLRASIPSLPPGSNSAAPLTLPTAPGSAAASNAPTAWVARGATNALEAQIALAGLGFSAGSIDGIGGSQTAAALKAFQSQRGLEPTGWLDRETRRALVLRRPPLATYRIQPEDLLRLAPVPETWVGKSQVAGLEHETLLERLAERFQAHPAWLRRINPGVDWDRIAEAQELVVPAPAIVPARRAALVRIHLGGRYLRVYDSAGELLAHFPCSIARRVEKRPVGELQVVVTVPNPDYTWDPAVFPESPEARTVGRKLRLPPGPNNPVGVAWIGLNRAGYGIHGTPKPEEVGRTESHGCFRLANWNADLLRRMAWPGLPVVVEGGTPPASATATNAVPNEVVPTPGAATSSGPSVPSAPSDRPADGPDARD